MKKKNLIDIALNSIDRYDLVGEYDLYIDQQEDGDYYKAGEVRELLEKLLYEE